MWFGSLVIIMHLLPPLFHENMQNKNRHAGHVQRHRARAEDLGSLLHVGNEVGPPNEER